MASLCDDYVIALASTGYLTCWQKIVCGSWRRIDWMQSAASYISLTVYYLLRPD
jgi:hypothetical protein